VLNTQVIATAAVAWLAGISALAPSPGAHRALTPPVASSTVGPQLDIAVTDGRSSAAVGDQLTYTIKVRNLGTTTANNLQISESLPAGLKLVSTDGGGAADADRIIWSMDLKPGADATLTTVGRVGQTPSTLLRLATVACAAVAQGRKPLVCATHSDLLPAGAAVAVANRPTSHRIWYAIGAVAIAAVAMAAAILLSRRRSGHHQEDHA